MDQAWVDEQVAQFADELDLVGDVPGALVQLAALTKEEVHRRLHRLLDKEGFHCPDHPPGNAQ